MKGDSTRPNTMQIPLTLSFSSC